MEQNLDAHLTHFASHPNVAKQLASIGEYRRARDLDPVEVASYTTIANMLLNLDEVVTQH